MASYKAGFDPPSRQGDSNQNRSWRMGIYTQASLEKQEKQEHREADISHISGQEEGKRRAPLPQTGLPRPSMRDPPSLRPRPDAQRATPSTNFGYVRPGIKPPGPAPLQPQLKGKSSRNVLRRKQSSIAMTTGPPSELIPAASQVGERERRPSATGRPQPTERRPSVDSSFRSAEAYNEIFTRPAPRASPAIKDSPPIIPELDRYRSQVGPSRMRELPHKLSTQDLPPPFPSQIVTPVYSGSSGSHNRYSGYSGSGYSVSPSTRFSESPGPGASAYSRDTTPTSMSSQSPGIFLPLKAGTPRLRQGSVPIANRPPVSSITRRRTGSTELNVTGSPIDSSGLSVVRESLTSSSSNSTVKGDGKGSDKKKKKRLSPLPPSPPPRKSSQKFKKPSPGEFNSPSKTSQSPAKPIMMPPQESFESPSKLSKSAKPAMMSSLEPSFSQTSRPQARNAPPVRPSRENTPDLQNQLGESMTVIQSNLAGLNFPSDGRRSAIPQPLQVQTKLRPQGSRIPSRNQSPSPVLPLPREATPAPSGLGIIPDLKPRQMPSSSRGTTPSPSQASKPRFGLFGRRTKTEPVIDSKDKAPRKGPAAGTGHEGYGKYGLRSRSSSQGGLGRRERSLSIASSSQESITSTTATYDPFLLHRMSPVIIAGGGEIIENRNSGSGTELYRTDSNTSLLLDRGRPSMDSKGSSKSNLSKEASRATLWPSALPRENVKRASAIATAKGRRPSDSSDDGFVGKQNTLALRRSMQRLGDHAVALNLPTPLNIPTVGMSPSMTSLDVSLMSDDSQLHTAIEVHGRKAHFTKPKKLEKRPKSPTKWNFFHRSKPAAKTAAPAMAVSVGKPAKKAVPHYAMLDSSDEQQEGFDATDLEDIMRDAAVVGLSNEELDKLQFGEDAENLRRNEGLRINVPASKPEPSSSVPELKPAPIFFSSPEPLTPDLAQKELHIIKETAPVRPSRLPQVGRIPKVISARPETTSPKSFSRPFARLSVAHPQQLVVTDTQSVAVGPSPPKPGTPEPLNPESRQSSGDAVSKTESTSTASHRDFLAFSPRKNSEATTSSSGGLSISLINSNVTAIIPEADAELEEDEVWDEYDDLIENDETIKIPTSATSSHGVPFQYESYESRRIRKSKMRAKESPTLNDAEAPKLMDEEPMRASHLTSSSVYSQEMSARLKEALTTLPTPTTPMSFTDFFQGYGDRNKRSSQTSSRKSGSSESRTLSGLLSVEEQENPSPRSQVNLRVGSMTVSKWLTFGHVLFSPAREDISGLEVEGSAAGMGKAHSILVIDGLGNGMSFHPIRECPLT